MWWQHWQGITIYRYRSILFARFHRVPPAHHGEDDDAGLAEELRPHNAEQQVEDVEAGAVQEVPPRTRRKVLHMNRTK